jgi:NCAIR mutase (PurE)-related protein
MSADRREILAAVAAGECTIEAALEALDPIRNLGFARVDLQRARRRGVPEVVFGAGKTPEQMLHIAKALRDADQRVLITRVDSAAAAHVQAGLPDSEYDAQARCLWAPAALPPVENEGLILVIAAGTADGRVAAEAACVARQLQNRVERLDDVGVAGLHRLLSQIDRLRSAQVLIVCAGMEGALPSVVAGLVSRPVIAVPTSVGYGAGAGGVAALLGMLTSCAAGVSVVNIDNGFGAAYSANLINQTGVDP